MKNLTILFLLTPYFIYAQPPCQGRELGDVFQANRIGTMFTPQGEKFYDTEESYYKVPYTSENSPSTIFASSPWVGGYVFGEVRVAGQSYLGGKHDFYNGPLDDQSLQLADCKNYDRVWSVTRNEIESHLLDYNADGVIHDTITAIFGWPANGNVFFGQFNGFLLPDDHNGGWAEFNDLNNNGIYNPESGEHPSI